MSDDIFKIGADGVNTEQIMTEIRARVAAKTAAGVYRDARVMQVEKANLAHLKDDESVLSFYLECLRQASIVDINDFEIQEKRPLLAPLLVKFKKVIWSLLKFYTYRLWTQQNQVNGLLVTAIEGLDEKYRNRITDLERRLAALEGRKPGSCPPPNA